MSRSNIAAQYKTIPFQQISCTTLEQEATLAMYIACHGSIKNIDHLSKACQKQFKDASSIKLNRSKCTQVINKVLAPHFETELITDIGNKKFSLLIDESTDIAITKLLGIAVNYFSGKNGKVISTFLSLCEIERGDTMTIVTALKNEMKRLNLNMKNIVGIGTDNANVMVGKKDSVYTILKKEIPHLIAIRCVCHSVQLAVSHACKECLPTELEFLVSDTYLWFSKSSPRQIVYKRLYNAINEGMDPLKITRACDTRWLSIEVAASRILHQWLELKTHFNIAAEVEKCHKAKVLYNLYCDKSIYAVLLFIKPILSNMQKINKMFQSNNADPTKLLKDLELTFAKLQEKIISPEREINVATMEYKSFVENNCYLGYAFENHIAELKNTNMIEVVEERNIRSICIKFTIKLIDELKNRLPDNFEILKNVDVFSPEKILCANKADVIPILQHFSVSADEVDIIRTQYNTIHLIKWTNTSNTNKFWAEVRTHKDAAGNEVFANLSQFVMNILSLPWSNAEVERLFSQMNIIKTKLRNRMKIPTLYGILSIRYGLKRNNKCCLDYSVPKDVLLKISSAEKYSTKDNDDNNDNDDDNDDEDEVFTILNNFD